MKCAKPRPPTPGESRKSMLKLGVRPIAGKCRTPFWTRLTRKSARSFGIIIWQRRRMEPWSSRRKQSSGFVTSFHRATTIPIPMKSARLQPFMSNRNSGAGARAPRFADLHYRLARQEKFVSVTLWVLSSNAAARKFYETMGFSLDGATKVDRSMNNYELHEVRYRISV